MNQNLSIIRINGQSVVFHDNVEMALINSLSALSIDFPYQTFDTIKENILKLFDQFEEFFFDDKAAKKILNKINKFIKNLDNVGQKNPLIKMIYNFMLGLEGLSELTGFGFASKYGDKLFGNSKKTSVREKKFENNF